MRRLKMPKTLTISIPNSVYNKIQNGGYLKALVGSGAEATRAIYEWWMNEKLKTHGEFPTVRKSSMKTGEKVLRDLILLDLQSTETILMCIDLSLRHEFWKDNILSLASLRNRCSDGATKYEHLLKEILKTKKEERSDFGSFKLL